MALDALESESIEILREGVAAGERPVLMYSIGKDSSVLLHLARKAFHPGPLPFPLLHVDTTWKFKAMYAHRERMVREAGARLIVHTNADGLAAGVTPFTHGSSYYTDVMKTEALRQALDAHRFDVIFGGARRDEEASRAKERVCSFRSQGHRWDPKAQRPELWAIYNLRIHPGESIRVFPLSNWTEIDVWHYNHVENIPIVPMYYAREREVIVRGNSLIVQEQPFVVTMPGEKPQVIRCRMRSLGCSPCTGAIRSEADTIPKIIEELIATRQSERQLRIIDHDQDGSMELKKREGYF